MMLGQKMQNMWIYVYVKFSKHECQQWRMVLCEWCVVLKQVLEHVLRGGGRALPYLAYTGQVCAAEHKVLSSKQGVEFYY